MDKFKREPNPIHIDMILDEVCEEIKKPDFLSVKTGIKSLDKLTGGLDANRVNVVAARTSDGKTTFACQLAVNICLMHKSVCFITLEDSPKSLLRKMLCNLSNLSADVIGTSYLTDEQKHQLEDAKLKLRSIDFLFFENFGYEMSELDKLSELLVPKPDVIIFDYIQLVKYPGLSRYDAISNFVRELHWFAKRNEITVVALSQINRGNMDAKRPYLHHMSQSGVIEEVASMVILLRYPSRWNGHTLQGDMIPSSNYFELIVDKHKEGPTGHVAINFIQPKYRFEEL